MHLKKSVTHRGFDLIEFNDLYGEECNIQKSSLATQDAIWFGIDTANPQIFRTGEGWKPYPIPEDVLLTTRMHLSQEQVKELLPILTHFAKTGSLPD